MFLGTFITWTDSQSDLLLGYISDLITDFLPLLTIIISVGIGLIVVGAIIKAIRG